MSVIGHTVVSGMEFCILHHLAQPHKMIDLSVYSRVCITRTLSFIAVTRCQYSQKQELG